MVNDIKWVFIDSNAFLTLYSYNYDPSAHLKKILRALEDNKIELILTEQVIDEVERNREKILGRFIKELSSWKESTLNIPPFCKDIAPAGAIKKLSKKLYEKVLKYTKEESLAVDKIFKKIGKKSKIRKITPEIIDEARERLDRGNPPKERGKKENKERNRSYGDSINWTILLKEIPKGQNLYFIGEDPDFLSDLGENIFSLFLSKEFFKKKKSEVIYYSTISEFLQKEFKDTTIKEEEIKQEKSALPKSTQVYGIYASGANVVPYPFSSGAYVTSGAAIVPNQAIDKEEIEIKCSKCNRIFYVGKHSLTSKICPHCGHTYTPSIIPQTFPEDPFRLYWGR